MATQNSAEQIKIIKSISNQSIKELSHFANQQEFSRLLNTLSLLVSYDKFDEKIAGTVNNYLIQINEQRPSLKSIEELIEARNPAVKNEIERYTQETNKAVAGLGSLSKLLNNVNMNYYPIFRKLSSGSPAVVLFFDYLRMEGVIDDIIEASKKTDETIFGGVVYAMALEDAMNYAYHSSTKNKELIPYPTSKLLPLVAKGVRDIAEGGNTFDKNKLINFTKANKNVLLSGSGYQEAGHFAGALFDPNYKLDQFDFQYLKDRDNN